MQAMLMTAAGGPDVLQLQQIAEPMITQATEIKVRLHAAGVNPVDTKIRGRGLFASGELPAVLGCDGAGEVIAVGPEVQQFQPGDPVWFCHGGLGAEQGNYAQYTVLDEAIAQTKPKSLSFVEAAAAPLVLITAWEALHDRGRVQQNQSVLIHAGAGGVGHVAIQLAKLAGARVITTVSNQEKADFVRQLGADEVILYSEQDVTSAVLDLTQGQGADLVLDTVGGTVFANSIPAVAHYGDLITLLDPGNVNWKEARNRNLRISFTLMLTPMLRDLPAARAHQGEILRQCADLFDQGKLQIKIAQTFSLTEAAAAHQLLEAGHLTGKLVLEIPA